MSSIRLHPKYGLNPTMRVCFWCGNDTSEIALLGAAYKEQAPMRMTTSLAPCKICEDDMAKGVTCIEVTDVPGKVPAIQAGAYPTGRWSVIKREAAVRMLGEEHPAVQKGKCLVHTSEWDIIGLSPKGE